LAAKREWRIKNMAKMEKKKLIKTKK